MRLDVYLKWMGLCRRRSEAKAACDQGQVRLDGQAAKAASSVRPGTRISIEAPTMRLEAEVVELPGRAPAKKQRGRYVRVLSQERLQASAVIDEDLSF